MAARESGDEIVNNAGKTVLVTGATGRQGGSVIDHMLGKGWTLRALVRNPGGDAEQALARRGVELVQGDFDDPATLERAARGAYGLYSVQNFWAVGARREVQQGKSVADAAKNAGVAHVVYSSVGGVERNSGIGHWASKWAVERYMRSLDLPATMLRPAAFMENYYSDQMEIGLLQGKLVDGLQLDKPYQTIAADDIGAFVALAFERPDEFIGLELEIAGSELTNLQAAEVFSRVLGKPVVAEQLPLAAVREAGEEYYQMYRWFNEDGFHADIAELRRRYPQVHLHRLEEWLRSEGWHKRARHLQPPPA
jgi:uncharacterized protein YbjT (DUF2867 family)